MYGNRNFLKLFVLWVPVKFRYKTRCPVPGGAQTFIKKKKKKESLFRGKRHLFFQKKMKKKPPPVRRGLPSCACDTRPQSHDRFIFVRRACTRVLRAMIAVVRSVVTLIVPFFNWRFLTVYNKVKHNRDARVLYATTCVAFVQ